jgi:hypothetical protein
MEKETGLRWKRRQAGDRKGDRLEMEKETDLTGKRGQT